VFFSRLAAQWRELHALHRHMAVGDLVEQVADQVKPATALVVEVHGKPRRIPAVCSPEHRIAGAAVIRIVRSRLDIDG
jgi:hypothetical protein